MGYLPRSVVEDFDFRAGETPLMDFHPEGLVPAAEALLFGFRSAESGGPAVDEGITRQVDRRSSPAKTPSSSSKTTSAIVRQWLTRKKKIWTKLQCKQLVKLGSHLSLEGNGQHSEDEPKNLFSLMHPLEEVVIIKRCLQDSKLVTSRSWLSG